VSPELAVVHLVRAKNGVAPLERFLASSRRHRAGIEHELVMVFKGFPGDRLPPEYQEILGPWNYRPLFVTDRGYDISAYFHAARWLRHERLCFLNSFSLILAEDWLLKLHSQASRDGVGIVAPTGSYQSVYSDLLSRQFRHVHRPLHKKILLRLFPFLRPAWNRLKRPVFKTLFDPFPNYHIRTNGFMLRREVLLGLQQPRVRTKFDAYLFESGKKSLTRQIMAMEKSPLVVGRDGSGYRVEDWHCSNTFWQSDQENLLIADNQTHNYQSGSMQARREYSSHAWGALARPTPPMRELAPVAKAG
jgi:hypothetical protein